MLKEIFRKSTEIISIDFDLGIVTWKETLIADKESLDATALPTLFATAGEFDIKKGHKIYFFPGCTAPRFKVRQLCQKEDMSIVRTPPQATVAIVGDQTALEIVGQQHYNHICTKKDILNLIQSSEQRSTSFLSFISHLSKENITDEILCTTYKVFSEIKNTDQNILSYSERFWTASEANLNSFDIVMESDVPFVTQESLLKLITQGTLMTKEMYTEVDKMFDSSDKNNTVLAMELMANCDYEKSALYLLKLLSDNKTKINTSKQKNHVNFSSLCKFFDVLPGEALYFDDIIKKLTERKLINSSIKRELLDLATEEFANSDSMWFKSFLVPTENLDIAIEKGDAYMKTQEEQIDDSALEINENPFDV